jgi:hypothetical protein
MLWLSLEDAAMPDAKTAALLRTVLDEVCASISLRDTNTRTNVASKLLEAVKQEAPPSVEDLKKVGRQVLRPPTTA